MAGVTENDDKTRRILLVSYWYPPAIGAAAERLGAFARYLPNHGWLPHVLTAGLEQPPPDVAGVQVHAAADRLAGSPRPFADYDPRSKPSCLRSFLRSWVFPDRFVAWQKAAFEAGRKVISKHSIDIILASFPPASVAMLGLRLHQEHGIPLVVDFRDRWFGPGGYELTSGRMRRRHERLRREVIENAAAIVVVSQPMADALVDEHGFDRSRVWVVPNGYEPHDASPDPHGAAAHGGDTSKPFAISHVGTVIARNRPDLFFESLAALKADVSLKGILFRFVGNLSQDWIEAAGLVSLVETTGLLARERARREMESADALLLLTGSYVGKWGQNAKLFEYLRTSAPILCLEESPGSNDRRLLEELAPDRSFFAALNDPAGIAAQLRRLRAFQAARFGSVAPASPDLDRYSRPRLVAALAEHLASLG